MLLTIAGLLIVLWILGVVSMGTVSWFVHLLLVLAVIMILIRIIKGQDPF